MYIFDFLTKIEDQADRFKPITINCASIFKPFYESAAQRWKFPFFNWSLLYLTGSNHFFWKIERDCLLLLKRRVMGRYILNFICPPIHINKDTIIENEIIEKYLKMGVAIDIWESMKNTYIFPFGLRKVRRANGGLEPLFVIHDSTHPINLKGKNMKKFRKLKNRYQYLLQKGYLNVSFHNNFDDIGEKCKAVVRSWTSYRCRLKHSLEDRSEWIIKAKKLCFPLSILVHRDEKGKIIHFDLATEYANGYFISELGYKDYSSPPLNKLNISAISDYYQIKKHTASGMQVLDLGTTVDKESLIAKTIHKPLLVQKYRIKPPYLTTKEQYLNIL